MLMCACVTDSSGELDSFDDSDIEGETSSVLLMVCGFKSSVSMHSCGFSSLDCMKVSLLSLFRRSTQPRNLEVAAAPQTAPGLVVAQERYLIFSFSYI